MQKFNYQKEKQGLAKSQGISYKSLFIATIFMWREVLLEKFQMSGKRILLLIELHPMHSSLYSHLIETEIAVNQWMSKSHYKVNNLCSNGSMIGWYGIISQFSPSPARSNFTYSASNATLKDYLYIPSLIHALSKWIFCHAISCFV